MNNKNLDLAKRGINLPSYDGSGNYNYLLVDSVTGIWLMSLHSFGKLVKR